MSQLLSSLYQIALLRKDPGILPASFLLVALLALVYAVASALQAWTLYGSDRIVMRTVLDLGLSMASFWVILAVTRRLHRYAQTISAVLGTSVLLAPIIMVLLMMMQGAAPAQYPLWLMARIGAIAVTMWFLVIVAHILRGALETGLLTGLALALTWVIASKAIADRLFPLAS